MRRIFFIAILATIISLLCNFLAETMQAAVDLLGDFVVLRLSYNAGIAFGIAFSPALQSLLIGTALVAVLIYAFRTKHDALSSLAFGLILGGAAANLIDRFSDGLVTDYIAVGSFPIFNLADSCISIGAGLLIAGMGRKNG